VATVVLSPASLILANDGVRNIATVSITESLYAGTYSASVMDPTIASASVTGGILTVSALAIGTTTITVSDTSANTATLSVTVYGPLLAVATTPPNSSVGTFSVSKLGYTGTFTIISVDATAATVTPASATGPGPITVTVAPTNPDVSTLIRVTNTVGDEVDITINIQDTDLNAFVYTLVDAGGVNPLPPGVLVRVYPVNAQQNPQTLVDSGYTLIGGSVQLDLPLSTAFVAVFIGSQAPRQAIAFTSAASSSDTAALTIRVNPYTSPVLSQAGYASSVKGLYPTNWLANESPIADDLCSSIGIVFAAVDQQEQKALAAMRIYTCEDVQLDSWAQDFLGDFPRYQSEPYTLEGDNHYRARIIVALITPNCTLNAIQSKVQAYIDGNPAAQQGTVIVFDLQSNPTLAAQVGIVDGDGKFCVLLPSTTNHALAFFVNRSYLNRNSYLIALGEASVATDVDPNIIDIVNRTKVGGYRPIYAQIQN
jgi:hypothetical protein